MDGDLQRCLESLDQTLSLEGVFESTGNTMKMGALGTNRIAQGAEGGRVSRGWSSWIVPVLTAEELVKALRPCAE